jgi:hypothetical protein
MKTTLLAALCATIGLTLALPAAFAAPGQGSSFVLDHDFDDFDRKKRKKGGKKKVRVPGGSGCDDPGDVAEHA